MQVDGGGNESRKCRKLLNRLDCLRRGGVQAFEWRWSLNFHFQKVTFPVQSDTNQDLTFLLSLDRFFRIDLALVYEPGDSGQKHIRLPSDSVWIAYRFGFALGRVGLVFLGFGCLR